MVAIIAGRLGLGGVPVQLGILKTVMLTISRLKSNGGVVMEGARDVRPEKVQISRADSRPHNEARDGAVVCELIKSL
jgi:hypothetical protein